VQGKEIMSPQEITQLISKEAQELANGTITMKVFKARVAKKLGGISSEPAPPVPVATATVEPNPIKEIFGNARKIQITKVPPRQEDNAQDQANRGVSIRTAADGQRADDFKRKLKS
jgi:hypothetical protein